jgi:hypothetical protein
MVQKCPSRLNQKIFKEGKRDGDVYSIQKIGQIFVMKASNRLISTLSTEKSSKQSTGAQGGGMAGHRALKI